MRISNNAIVNISSIQTIERYSTDNFEYSKWMSEYDELMKDVVAKYISENIDILKEGENDEEKIANMLYEKFAPIIRKNITETYGECPEAYIYEYKIVLVSGQDFYIDVDTFDRLCEILNIDMSD